MSPAPPTPFPTPQEGYAAFLTWLKSKARLSLLLANDWDNHTDMCFYYVGSDNQEQLLGCPQVQVRNRGGEGEVGRWVVVNDWDNHTGTCVCFVWPETIKNNCLAAPRCRCEAGRGGAEVWREGEWCQRTMTPTCLAVCGVRQPRKTAWLPSGAGGKEWVECAG